MARARKFNFPKDLGNMADIIQALLLKPACGTLEMEHHRSKALAMEELESLEEKFKGSFKIDSSFSDEW